MSNIHWRLRRLGFMIRRINGSIAARGWIGTLKRIRSERARARAAGIRLTAAVPQPSTPAAGRRMLVVDSMVPDPTRDSGSVRLLHILRQLRNEGWIVDFFPDDGIFNEDDEKRLAAIEVPIHKGNLLHWLMHHGASLDAVMLCRLNVAQQHIAIARKYARNAIIAFDTVDLHYIRESRAAALQGSGRMLRQAQRSRRLEIGVVAMADVTFVVSEEERTVLAGDAPGAAVLLLSNIHEPVIPMHGFDQRNGLLFVGGFGHPPNADAMQWFVTEIFPLLRSEEPDVCLNIVGDIDDAARRKLAGPGVNIHGRVRDLLPLIESCRVSVAPLRFGAGVKGKVNEAMSHGLPVVLTPMAAEGMHLTQGTDALIAATAPDFAQAVLSVYRDKALWSRLSEAGMANVRIHFSAARALETLRSAFPLVAKPSPD